MAHIMFVRALTVLLFLTTAANAGSMKELALIALLGGGDLACDGAYFSKGQLDFMDWSCQMTTEKYGLCELAIDESESLPFFIEIKLIERNGKLFVYDANPREGALIDGLMGTCDKPQ